LDQLEVGDIISTEQLANQAAEVSWNSQVLFRGTPGVYKGSKALRLAGFQEPNV
jgi:flagellar motor switch protein FliM